MEDYNYEMINIFNKNFISSDFKNILRLYKKEISIVQYPEENKFQQEYKYQHPLFKNYNYCFFCEKKEKTKYTKILNHFHIPLKSKTIGDFLLSNKIKLRPIYNKKIKLTKRRFIQSCDNIKNNKIYNEMPCGISDTELYNNDDNVDLEVKKKKIKEKIKNNNKNLINGFVDKIYSPFYEKNKGMNNLITKNEEKKSSLDNLSRGGTKTKIKYDQDEIKTNFNMEEDSFKNSNNNNISKPSQKIKERKIEINDSNISNKKPGHFNIKKYNNNSKEEEMQESSNINSEMKLSVTEKGDKEEESKNSFSDKEGNEKNNAVFDIVNQTKKFFGFGKKSSKNREGMNNKRTHSAHYLRGSKIKKGNKINYAENNCSICFQEIKEKFTLICGDFFCSGCIRETILTAMKEISNLDKLSCPTCKEPIEINTIKKLLTEDEFDNYKYLMTKIEGYRNEEFIPCPFPDCPDFAPENQFNGNIVICQNGHTFCKKCLTILDKNMKENEHKCFENISEEEQKTLDFFKKNKNYRKCPKCQNRVVREGGECNNMTCTNIWCGYEFCWICMGKYEDSHYKNPISMCFGLGEVDNDRKLLKYSRIRFCRCVLIFLLLIFIILPVVITFFSVFISVIYVLAFVLDGSHMKHTRLKNETANKFFYKIVYAFFLCISIAFIPFGYVALVIVIIGSPILCIYNKIKKKNGEEME